MDKTEISRNEVPIAAEDSVRPVLIFGASRGTGLLLAQRLRQGDVPVYAMLRPPSDAAALHDVGVRVLRGDAFQPSDIRRAYDTLDVPFDVVSTLGGCEGKRYADDEGNSNLVDQIASAGFVRFVLVTSIGCGDMAPYRSERAIAAFGDSVDAKTRAEEHLRRTLPDATIIRPGGLLSDEPTGKGLLCTDPQLHGFITRTNLADLIVRVLGDPETRGMTLAAVDADRMRCINPIAPFPLGS